MYYLYHQVLHTTISITKKHDLDDDVDGDLYDDLDRDLNHETAG